MLQCKVNIPSDYAMLIRPFRLFLIPLILCLCVFPAVLKAQGNPPVASIALQDYEAYKKSPFAGSLWDPIVQEGFLTFDKEDTQTAIEFLRKAVNSGCQSPLVYFKLALSYEMQGSYYSAIQYYELARESFKKANQDHRYFKDFNTNYGRALYMMGQTEKALPLLEAAAANVEEVWILKLLAENFLSKGDVTKGGLYAERLLRLPAAEMTDKINLCLSLARLYQKGGDEAQTVKYYELVAALDPLNGEAKTFLQQRKSQKSLEKVYEMMEESGK